MRKADLPIKYPQIAFAPWFSVPCTKSYLAASTGARAFMTYLPDNGVAIPPLVNDEVWDLHDGGRWKAQSKFPVYAIPGAGGAAIMQQMGQYSSNSSNSKIADILAQEEFDASDYVRLYTAFGTSDASNLPTLWAFLLIVLGLVLVVIGTTSFLMHWVQRRRRRDLQRRVANGEVDLESLGIKRTRITQEAIDSLPTSIYTQRARSADETRVAVDPSSVPSSDQTAPKPVPDHSHWSQPTCPICLDDFVPNITTIRPLPCYHIYHPQCIDPFLRENSSLCPVCKAVVLSSTSKFYISEPVTNAMVRHERRVRRMRRERQARTSQNSELSGGETESRRWIGRFRRGSGRRAVGASGPNPTAPTTTQMELGAMESRAFSESTQAGAAVEGAGAGGPSSTGAEAGMEVNGAIPNPQPSAHDITFHDEEAEDSLRRPRCECSDLRISSKVVTRLISNRCVGRKALRAAFPGFR